MDSFASDCSVEEREPRHREDPASGRGKSKRVMTALTTDSDTRPDSLRGTDRNNRHLRQVSPRVYHARNLLDGTAPPFPPESPDLGAIVDLLRLTIPQRNDRV